MLKAIAAIEAKVVGRVAPPMKRLFITKEVTAPCLDILPPCLEYKLALRVESRMVGPEEARPHLLKHAQALIAHEIFGDVESHLREILHLAWEDNASQEVTDKIESLINLCRGGS